MSDMIVRGLYLWIHPSKSLRYVITLFPFNWEETEVKTGYMSCPKSSTTKCRAGVDWPGTLVPGIPHSFLSSLLPLVKGSLYGICGWVGPWKEVWVEAGVWHVLLCLPLYTVPLGRSFNLTESMLSSGNRMQAIIVSYTWNFKFSNSHIKKKT